MGYYETLNAIAKDMENIYKVIKEDLDKGTTFPQWAIWSFSKMTQAEDKALLNQEINPANKGEIPYAIRQMLLLDDMTPNKLIRDFSATLGA